jgi:hypothetical protein
MNYSLLCDSLEVVLFILYLIAATSIWDSFLENNMIKFRLWLLNNSKKIIPNLVVSNVLSLFISSVVCLSVMLASAIILMLSFLVHIWLLYVIK